MPDFGGGASGGLGGWGAGLGGGGLGGGGLGGGGLGTAGGGTGDASDSGAGSNFASLFSGGPGGGMALTSLFSGGLGGGGGGFGSAPGGDGVDTSSSTTTASTDDSVKSSADVSPADNKKKKKPASKPSTAGPTPPGCKAYRMIGARGTTEGPSGSIAYSALEKKILGAVPGGAIDELQYDTSADYSYTVTQGAQTGIKMITTELAKCPNTLYALFGYSKGSMVISQVLSSNKIPSANIAAVVLYGNPYFKAGARQNKCSAKTGAGIAGMMSVKLPEDIVDRVFDCCNTGDTICQTAGTILAHLSYGDGEHMAGAFDFVVKNLQALLGKK
ncbi:hypothetical protein PTTG_01286 [Puccinia triticina 1-1 BBBD Race 1]|uniref:Cutinase n=1 Tax=Puccinia triticina (isolate 1-1 / race 1 (BBBD)) TaxID=630390 RepID=A0A180GYE9_PUCT1|nr:hypothetical protein PTTG_01286 [Puccinia triticina 1-1 BBBD Race 1]